MQSLGKSLFSFSGEDLALFHSVLIDVSTDENQEKRRDGYNGASVRLRKKFEQALIKELNEKRNIHVSFD